MTKRFRLVNFILVIALLLCGCGGTDSKRSADDAPAGENMINIYYPEGYAIRKTENAYQLMQPDTLSTSIEEVLAQMMPLYDDRLQFNTYLLDENNNLTLELRLTGEYSREEYLLVRASIAKTLFQLTEIRSILMMLQDETGETVSDETLTRDSFFYFQ